MTSDTLRIFPAALMALVPAATMSADFEQALLPHKLCFPIAPLDPRQTLAELLAANRGGRRRLRYGTITSYLRGATLLDPSGRQLELGGQTVKNVTGYALTQLLAGAGQDFGQVTSLTLTLRPLPRARRACLLAFARPEHACTAATALLHAHAQPNCLAMLDAAAREQAGGTSEGATGALLLAEYDGHPAALDRQSAQLLALAAEHGGTLHSQADAAPDVAAIWQPWEQLEHWLNGVPAGTLSLDLTLPRRSLPEFATRAQALAQAYRLRLLLWGDAGVGNLHPTLCWDAAADWREAEAFQAALLLWQLAESLGGSAAGERGNVALAPALARSADPVAARLRAGIVSALHN